MRPCITTTGRPSSFPSTTHPACPGAVGTGQCGMSSTSTVHGSSTASATAPSPDPSTTAVSGSQYTLCL